MKTHHIKIVFQNGEVFYDMGGHGILVDDVKNASTYGECDAEIVFAYWGRVLMGVSPQSMSVRHVRSPIKVVTMEAL